MDSAWLPLCWVCVECQMAWFIRLERAGRIPLPNPSAAPVPPTVSRTRCLEAPTWDAIAALLKSLRHSAMESNQFGCTIWTLFAQGYVPYLRTEEITAASARQ